MCAAIHLRHSSATARWDRFGHPEPLPKYGRSASRRCGGATPTRRPRSASELEGRIARMALLTRRHVLGLGVGALGAAPVRGRPRAAEGGAETPRHVGVRRPEISGRLPSFRLRQSGRAEGRDVFDRSRRSRAYNQSFQTFNSLNAFILKGEGAQGMDLTFATLMARAGDEPDAMYGLVGEVGADFAGQADLSLHAAAGGAISRRHETDRAGRRVLAEHAEGEGPSADHRSRCATW